VRSVDDGSQRHAMYFGLAAVLCWSTVATAFKISLFSLTPIQLILIASAVSWLFLIAVLLIKRRLLELFSQSPKVYLSSFLFGLLNPLLYYLLLFSAYSELPAQEAQAINYSWAIVMSIMAVPMLRHRMNRIDVLAALICYFGILLIATRGDVLELEFANLKGVVLAIASTFVWSLYWILNQKDPREPVLGLCLNFTFAIPVILVLAWQQGGTTDLLQQSNWSGVLAGTYVGVFEMGLAFVLWLKAMKMAESTARVANLVFLSPFLSLWLISVFLEEPIMMSTLTGLACILFGLLLQQTVSPKLQAKQGQ